ncbi:hypothetical protein F4604DRAFT_1680626 [Suillus subluteus]|nr:hypothetical protein F4604DRAFT_1680626 [Suillus subluteus]
MHNTSTSTVVPPFYDPETGAPPPFPPMLTDQLELFGHVDRRPTTLIADEVLVPKASIIPAARALSSTPAPEFKLAKWMLKQSEHSSSPYLKKVTFPFSNTYSDSSSTSGESLLEDLKIPKPAGEPGRPGRGGYTLYEALDWNPKMYTKFKKNVHNFIEDHLDTTKCASAQSPALLKVVRDKVNSLYRSLVVNELMTAQALNDFPDLENYSNLWPVNDLIMTRLKYTSSRARRKEGEMSVGKKRNKK